jgi:hypothetical protein
MIRAINIYGNGDWSTITPVTTYDKPAKMSIPTVTLSGTDVLVGFTTPDEHFSTITAYEIRLKKSDTLFYDATSLCAESQATIITQQYCTMTMVDIVTFTSRTAD